MSPSQRTMFAPVPNTPSLEPGGVEGGAVGKQEGQVTRGSLSTFCRVSSLLRSGVPVNCLSPQLPFPRQEPGHFSSSPRQLAAFAPWVPRGQWRWTGPGGPGGPGEATLLDRSVLALLAPSPLLLLSPLTIRGISGILHLDHLIVLF